MAVNVLADHERTRLSPTSDRLSLLHGLIEDSGGKKYEKVEGKLRVSLAGSSYVGLELNVVGHHLLVYGTGGGESAWLDADTGSFGMFRRGVDGRHKLSVGREEGNDVLYRGDYHVSSHHADVVFDPISGQYKVEDKSSGNGLSLRPVEKGLVNKFVRLSRCGSDVDRYVAVSISRWIGKSEVDAMSMDEADRARDPKYGKKALQEMARSRNVRPDLISDFEGSQGPLVAGREFTYVVDDRGKLYLGDISTEAGEWGVKHHQLASWGEKQGAKNFIFGGMARFDSSGAALTIDNDSGSFHFLDNGDRRQEAMQKVIDLLSVKWGVGVVYRNVDGKGREVLRVKSKRRE